MRGGLPAAWCLLAVLPASCGAPDDCAGASAFAGIRPLSGGEVVEELPIVLDRLRGDPLECTVAARESGYLCWMDAAIMDLSVQVPRYEVVHLEASRPDDFRCGNITSWYPLQMEPIEACEGAAPEYALRLQILEDGAPASGTIEVFARPRITDELSRCDPLDDVTFGCLPGVVGMVDVSVRRGSRSHDVSFRVDSGDCTPITVEEVVDLADFR